MNTDWYEGLDDEQANLDAAQRWMDLQVGKTLKTLNNDYKLGFWGDPIYLTGDYPESVLKNTNASILQRFTAEQKEQNLGAADFVGLNHYTTRLVTDGNKDGGFKSFLYILFTFLYILYL